MLGYQAQDKLMRWMSEIFYTIQLFLDEIFSVNSFRFRIC